MPRVEHPPSISGRQHDLGGGMLVRRLLPSAQRSAVGPFVFMDHFGPSPVGPDAAQDVRPHPHIGLGTLTYLFDGAILHRDSLGTVQLIEPGAINWMRAGRGVVHSERRPPDLPGQWTQHGLQFWLALPLSLEASEPAFEHTPAAQVPLLELDGAQVRLLLGAAWGHQAGVATGVDAVCLDICLPADQTIKIPALAPELAVYAAVGSPSVDGTDLPSGHLQVLAAGCGASLQAGREPVRCVVVGGAALDAPRYLWWNFVSSHRERIVRAADDWEAGRMPVIPGDRERIPLPPRRFKR
ncbi:pirin family protein [Acidovorax lacteus]|uniref:Pirin family protein n=1 Tax=Acidovorax lacteus TaxID=1924988 RepID=A0ABP8L2M5_9BURK